MSLGFRAPTLFPRFSLGTFSGMHPTVNCRCMRPGWRCQGNIGIIYVNMRLYRDSGGEHGNYY